MADKKKTPDGNYHVQPVLPAVFTNECKPDFLP